MQRPASVRILELSAVVQMQTKIIFTSISSGDFETVRKIIADGDFFDANIESKVCCVIYYYICTSKIYFFMFSFTN